LHGNRKGCLKGTRGAILDEIELWTRDSDQHSVYWLNGLAGTGKSTIAQTIAERVFAGGQLGASFFCSQDFEDRSNLQLIFPTIAVQLARRYPKFRSIFIPLVQSDPEIVHESLYSQMNKLIVGPLKESAISTVIIIDALDECKDDQPASAILSVLGQSVLEIPNIKFFLTGRPESHIQDGFDLPPLVEATNIFILHNIDLSIVESDIWLFLKQSFQDLADRHGLGDWPTREQLDCLCERAAGLFVYAVATVKFISQRNKNPREQLDHLLQSPESSAYEGKTKFMANKTMDSLYMSILQKAYCQDDPDDDDDPRIQSVLGAMTLAANPLSPSTIATLLGIDSTIVFIQLSSIRSLLILQDINSPVRPFHKSFSDFIIEPTRCTNQRFCISPPDHHSELLVCCLNLMNQKLEKNMCKIPDAVANSEVNDLQERIAQYIDHGLRYGCESWHRHLIDAQKTLPHTLKITAILHQFLEEKFLFWLEVLSVLGTVRNAVDALEAAAKWLKVCLSMYLIYSLNSIQT